MNITTIAQLASSVTNMISVIVIAAGYYFIVRVSKQTLDEMKAQRQAGGRPLVTIDFDYDSLPKVDLVICNVVGGPAWDISFEFEVPIENADGFVISDLPLLKRGLDYLAPDGKIGICWDDLSRLLSWLRDKGLHEGVSVTIRYKDLVGRHYATVSKLNPFLFEHGHYIRYRQIGDLVDAVEGAADKLASDGQSLKTQPQQKRSPTRRSARAQDR